MTYKIGAHVSASGGYIHALTRVKDIGGNCLQLFATSPRIWALPTITDEEISAFLDKKNKLGIDPIYFHASYLVNFADSGWIGEKSRIDLIAELEIAAKIDVKGSIIHLGSFKSKDERPLTKENYDTLLSNIQDVIDKTPENTFFIIENAGNRKICCTLDELGFIVKQLNNKRIRVCLDTCHFHAAGYDLSTQEKFDRFFDEFDTKVGLENLEVFQVNDSKDALGSFRDRHENIGEGQIPFEVFRLLLNDTRTKHLPFILEVPGEEKKGPDKKNINALYQLAND
jgi:apurinic endonuclease APN1